MALQKSVVVATALTLLDEVGAEGLSMRVLAKALDVQAPTLYWHFPSKQDLFDQMADAIIAPALVDIDTSGTSDAVLCSLAAALRKALLARRDGARIYAGTYGVGDNVLALAEIALNALLRKGLSEEDATDAMFNLVYFVLGFTIEEQGFRERWRTATDESDGRQQFAAALGARFPALQRCADVIVAGDFDRRFAQGMASFLRGLEVFGGTISHEPDPAACEHGVRPK
ncbi:TetR/AcrR family transcriptional regulator C-terminal domain-containing protein [Plastoroseomonas hellenica]|uniref:TetR/AcrR family transcriptional regulator C-terminal domain-containing protein n=1 Tax=Plastoroseomonas hellenica TaxID=2687306 RepID=UPI001BA56F8E|nr:TetR/AcrR family transcriptional regulator C-terminal domain-containing protein [Plastoroseomonas hellenica]MBR0642697.1 TetR family transcriptional regulator [Plastoroseomonas hellenica]